jgi:methionyl aminopeptidase
MVKLKSTAEIKRIAAAGHIVAEVLSVLEGMVKAGITTWELDQAARAIIRRSGAIPSFLGYGRPPFPAAICTSIDSEVVHGIPSPQRILGEGSLISIDVGACLDGYHADAARTFTVGKVDGETTDLIRVTEECFWNAFSLAKIGARLGDLSAAVQNHAESHGYGVVRELTGHGIGQLLHEEPDLPNFGRPGYGLRLEAGLVLAMEPMINQGTRRVTLLDDGWTIVTSDGKRSAHYENTLAVTADGPVVLTRL